MSPLINYRTDIAAERHAVLLRLEEILPHLRRDLFEQQADMRGDRIVAQHRMALLSEIADAERRKIALGELVDIDEVPQGTVTTGAKK